MINCSELGPKGRSLILNRRDESLEPCPVDPGLPPTTTQTVCVTIGPVTTNFGPESIIPPSGCDRPPVKVTKGLCERNNLRLKGLSA